MVFDGRGNLYFADRGNLRIREINAAGIISTVAGDGHFGFCCDGGPATNAWFQSATAVAFDRTGNLYIADPQVGRVRKVDTTGIIKTIAGNGQGGFSGDGSLATSATMGPSGVIVGRSGSIYIADFSNNRVRKVDTSGVISTIAGTGTAGFSGDNGPAMGAELSEPIALSLDPQGNLYVADYSQSNRVRRIQNVEPYVNVSGSPQQPLTTDGQGNFVVFVTITNSGNITLDSVQVTVAGSRLGSASLISAPASVKNLVPGASAVVTLTFPSGVASPSATTVPLKVTGTYSVSNPLLSGNWTLSFRNVSLK